MSKPRIVILIVVAAVVIVGVKLFSGDCSRSRKLTIRGDSMAGILNNADEVSARIGYYDCHDPALNDIVVLKYGGENSAPLAKQIRGVGGDVLSFGQDDYSSFLMLNGVPLLTTENKFFYIDSTSRKLLSSYLQQGGSIRKDVYLVLGNQPIGSTDSRSFGLIGKPQFIGRILR